MVYSLVIWLLVSRLSSEEAVYQLLNYEILMGENGMRGIGAATEPNKRHRLRSLR
jgi:hypothetical protein